MKWLMENLLRRRAQRLVRFLMPELPVTGQILDVGSGTGHNAACLMDSSPLTVVEADVVDMHTVGGGPLIFDGMRLPFQDAEFDTTLLLFVLQYTTDPTSLLKELRRVTAGRVLVLQSTYSGSVGYSLLRIWDFLTGRLAFTVAKAVGVVGTTSSSLRPMRFYERQTLQDVFFASGFQVRTARRFNAVNSWVTRTLYVLEPIPCSEPCR